jgi:hypothetical protein
MKTSIYSRDQTLQSLKILMAANGEGQTIQTDKKKKQIQDVAWLLRVRKSRKQMVIQEIHVP